MSWLDLPAWIDQPVVLNSSFDPLRWKRADAIAQKCSFGPGAIYLLLEEIRDDEQRALAVIKVAEARGVNNILAVAIEVSI